LLVNTVGAYLDAVTRGRADEIAALYAPEATVEDPVGSPVRRGGAAIREFYRALETGTHRAELLTLRVAGDSAAFHFRVISETAQGRVEIEPIDVMTFDEQGRITAMRSYWSADDVRGGA
jgi:steroid delta-isomerase